MAFFKAGFFKLNFFRPGFFRDDSGPTPPVLTTGQTLGRVILDAVYGGAITGVPLDFISGLQPNENLVSATTVAQLYSGTDSNPQGIVIGAGVIDASIVTQTVNPTIVGNIYTLIVTAITSNQRSLTLTAYLAVVTYVP